jgi:hypothetical protein
VVALQEDQAASFIRKYGTVIERTPGGRDRVENKRLVGIFHQLERGHVYLDMSGKAHDLILQHKDAAKGAIRQCDGIPTGGNDHQGHKKFKKYKK